MLKLKINKPMLLSTKISVFNMNDTKGFSALGMVIILLLLGMLLVNSLSKVSLSWQKSFIYNKLYYQHFNQAISAIEWGSTQTWQQSTQTWQCQSFATYQLTACIKQSTLSTGNFVMIKGQSEQITLYHLATFQLGILNIERGHWLDYCPESRSVDCD